MAQFTFSSEALKNLVTFRPPKLEPLVYFQSIPPGTTVPRGTTITVRTVSPSDVPISVAIGDVPVALKNIPLADLNSFVASNPDVVKETPPANFVELVNTRFNVNLTQDDAAQFHTVLANFGA